MARAPEPVYKRLVRKLSTAFGAASIVVASLIAIACGGNDNNPPPNAPTPAASSAAASASPTASVPQTPSTAASAQPGDAGLPPPAADTAGSGPKFADLPKDKKVEVMMTKVVPNVGKDFKDFDGKRFEKFGCATCHGPKKNQDPHAVLPKLTLSNGGFEKMQKMKPDMVKFMSEKVTPDMAAAMGEKPFDPATHTGFGCGGCHEVK